MFDDWAYRGSYMEEARGSSNGGGSVDDRGDTRRPRARSLLQQVALEKGIQGPVQEYVKLEDVGSPPKADVESKRRQSFSAPFEPLMPHDKLQSSFASLKTFPLSSVEFSQEEQSVNSWLDEADPFTDIAAVDEGTAEHATRFLENVSISSYNINKLVHKSDDVLNFLSELHSGFSYVGEITGSLQKALQDVESERKRLSKLSQEISDNLDVFTNLNKAMRMLNAPGDGIVTRKSFAYMLRDLDRGIDYVGRQKYVKDIDLYQMRYKQCMTRAMTLVHDYVCGTLKTVANSIDKQLTGSRTAVSSVTLNALLYDKFGSSGESVKQVSTYLAERADNSEYQNLYESCLKTYFDIRRKLLVPIVDRDLADLSKDPRNLLQTTRSSLSQFKEICLREQELFRSFFEQGHIEEEIFDNWLGQLCEPLYDALRQRIIREQDIEGLCEITAMLLSDYSPNQYDESHSQSQIYPLATDFGVFFRPILHDVQSRLVFRVQTHIQNEIMRYNPKPEDFQVAHRKETAASKNGDDLSDMAALLDGWYPPLSTAITLLSQIYQLVNSAVFDDLAHQIVHECIQSLEKLQALAFTRLGALETWLFMIKNYLMLRAQIIEFDIDQLPTQVQVDFSGIQDVLRSLRSEGINSENLLKLARATVPKVVNNMFDAKEELYAKLKNAIHNFTETAVGEIVKDISVTAGAKHGALLPTAAASTRAFRQLAATELPRIRELISTYIEDPKTVDILIDSIQDLVIQAYNNYMIKLMEEKPSPEQLDSLMDTDGIVSWLGDIVAKLHTYDSEESEADSFE